MGFLTSISRINSKLSRNKRFFPTSQWDNLCLHSFYYSRSVDWKCTSSIHHWIIVITVSSMYFWVCFWYYYGSIIILTWRTLYWKVSFCFSSSSVAIFCIRLKKISIFGFHLFVFCYFSDFFSKTSLCLSEPPCDCTRLILRWCWGIRNLASFFTSSVSSSRLLSSGFLLSRAEFQIWWSRGLRFIYHPFFGGLCL